MADVPQTVIDSEMLARLVEQAVAVRSQAYAPYSQFAVGAALLDDLGEIRLGVNVENAAYPIGNCAEASAIAAMILGGGRTIRAIAVAGSGPLLCSPCGGCRQRIREFANEETVVAMAAGGKLAKVMRLAELLPESFGPENLA